MVSVKNVEIKINNHNEVIRSVSYNVEVKLRGWGK